MKKLKDLIYDYNDIVLAILIIIIAGAVIFWKVSDIMAYPSFAKQSKETSQTEIDITDEDTQLIEVDPIAEPGEDFESGDGSDTTDTQTTQTQQETTQETKTTGVAKDTVFEVPSGYVGSKIANKLEKEGLCTAEEFTAAVAKLEAETKLRAGEFNIPAGSTPEDIVKIIANIQ